MKPTIVKPLMAVMAALLAAPTFAQQQAPDWLVSGLYGAGKMNAVVVVACIVLLGIAVWLFTMDRRVGRLERGK